MSDYAFREKTRVPVVHTYRLADCITSVLRSNSTKNIRAWLYLYHSAKGRWFVFLFASKVFQERHCAPSPFRMYRYGKQGRLSFQGCKPPCCICPICVWCVLFRIPLKLRPYKVPLLLHGESGRLLRKVRILPTRSWRLRLSSGMTMLPLLSVEIMFRFMASLGYGVTLPNDAFSLLPNIVRSLSSFCVVIFA